MLLLLLLLVVLLLLLLLQLPMLALLAAVAIDTPRAPSLLSAPMLFAGQEPWL
jgi:hypothetical protein